MPCLVILQNSSWQQPARMWQQPSNFFCCGNSVFCDLSIWTPKTTVSCINPCDLLSFEKAMLSCWPDSEAMPQAPRWQSMPTGETIRHMFAVCSHVFLRQWLLSTWIRGFTGQSIPQTSWQHRGGKQQVASSQKSDRIMAKCLGLS